MLRRRVEYNKRIFNSPLLRIRGHLYKRRLFAQLAGLISTMAGNLYNSQAEIGQRITGLQPMWSRKKRMECGHLFPQTVFNQFNSPLGLLQCSLKGAWPHNCTLLNQTQCSGGARKPRNSAIAKSPSVQREHCNPVAHQAA